MEYCINYMYTYIGRREEGKEGGGEGREKGRREGEKERRREEGRGRREGRRGGGAVYLFPGVIDVSSSSADMSRPSMLQVKVGTGIAPVSLQRMVTGSPLASFSVE